MAPGSHDVIVVGLGAMGSATLYQLARRGVRALGIDRFSPPHTLGSTHGDSRITRLAIGEGMAYVPLAMRSQELWRDLERRSGADLLTQNGCLILGRPDAEFGFHGKPNFLRNTIAAAKRYGIAHEVLDADEVRRRFPPFHLVGDEIGYHEPGGGFVRPEACVAAQLAAAAEDGAEIRRGERLLGIDADERGVRVRTAEAEHVAAKLVLCAGAWIPELLADPWRTHLSVYRQAMHWFDATGDRSLLSAARCPVYIWEVSGGDTFYGFPAIDGPGGGMKVATEQFEVATSADAAEHEVDAAESLAVYDRVVGARLPLARRVVKAVSCLYTATPDGDFVIDWHPHSERVLVVSPCSGHGFKHSAAIGEAAAELVTQGRSTVDLSPFTLARLAG